MAEGMKSDTAKIKSFSHFFIYRANESGLLIRPPLGNSGQKETILKNLLTSRRRHAET